MHTKQKNTQAKETKHKRDVKSTVEQNKHITINVIEMINGKIPQMPKKTLCLRVLILVFKHIKKMVIKTQCAGYLCYYMNLNNLK